MSGVTMVATLGVQLATECLAKAGQALALVVCRPQPALAHLPLENLVLGNEKLNDPLLVAVDPAGVDGEQKREGLGR